MALLRSPERTRCHSPSPHDCGQLWPFRAHRASSAWDSQVSPQEGGRVGVGFPTARFGSRDGPPGGSRAPSPHPQDLRRPQKFRPWPHLSGRRARGSWGHSGSELGWGRRKAGAEVGQRGPSWGRAVLGKLGSFLPRSQRALGSRPGSLTHLLCDLWPGGVPLRGLRGSVYKMSMTNPSHLRPGGQRLGPRPQPPLRVLEQRASGPSWPRVPQCSPRPHLRSPGLLTADRANHCPSALWRNPPKARVGQGAPPVLRGH